MSTSLNRSLGEINCRVRSALSILEEEPDDLTSRNWGAVYLLRDLVPKLDEAVSESGRQAGPSAVEDRESERDRQAREDLGLEAYSELEAHLNVLAGIAYELCDGQPLNGREFTLRTILLRSINLAAAVHSCRTPDDLNLDYLRAIVRGDVLPDIRTAS